ncbi:flap endonuclease Xni [Alginatibacterium sediminis]|uniref:Flap endonuclease Xni n=1 Tax=Alginatibacterium sediminis TaxID=2164068 RepID=A0A420EBR7_9ALTE|nr:flap endonuclease Xni [Alginatibacterium sediminis]RKF18104.1 flap endonuclease Xni [Alginatibacterium sediminis]
MHLVIIDALNLIRRIDAVQSKHNSDEAVLNSARSKVLDQAINKLQQRLNPSHSIAIFDAPTPSSWRYRRYPEYKAKRKPMSPNLQSALLNIRQHWQEQGLFCYINAVDEADDLIATLASKAAEQQVNVTIVSTDLGFHQLTNPRVQLYDYFKQCYLDQRSYFDKLNLQPPQLLDYLALIGNSGANIPGVAGVGPKSALQVLQRYGNIETALNNADDSVTTLKKIRDAVDDFQLAKELLSYRLDIELGFSLRQLRCDRQIST